MNIESDDEFRGHYYVPDYVIKYSDGELNNYMICDAKYSAKNKVRYKLIPNLSYKYLTSISPISSTDNLKGMYIFYGIVDENYRSESFYNVRIDSTKKIKPFIKLVPISEEIQYAYQENNAYDLLKNLTN